MELSPEKKVLQVVMGGRNGAGMCLLGCTMAGVIVPEGGRGLLLRFIDTTPGKQ